MEIDNNYLEQKQIKSIRTIVKPEENTNKNNEISEIIIVIRGEVFRGTVEQQLNCLDSIYQHICKPLLQNNINIEFCIASYKHEKLHIVINRINSWMNKDMTKDYTITKDKNSTQIKNFVYSLESASNQNKSLLIIRPDLLFKQDIEITRFNKNVFCFQWNYFHDSEIKEMPDQIHFIGTNILNDCIYIIKSAGENIGLLSNGQGRGSLHNLYNVLKGAGINDISYIMEYKLDEEAFEGNRCLLRGNPERSKLNDFYGYERKK
jgi:hypothetical protein